MVALYSFIFVSGLAQKEFNKNSKHFDSHKDQNKNVTKHF